MYETYYYKLRPYFGQKNLHLHYMDTDSFILNVNKKDIIKDLKNLEDIFDFNILDKNHGLFSNKNKEVIAKFKFETPKNIWIDEFICLRNKMYSFECGDDSRKILKGIFIYQSKHIKFEEIYNSLFGGEHQKNVIVLLFVRLTLNVSSKIKKIYAIFIW